VVESSGFFQSLGTLASQYSLEILLPFSFIHCGHQEVNLGMKNHSSDMDDPQVSETVNFTCAHLIFQPSKVTDLTLLMCTPSLL
jgi:hypothetical protein